MCHLPDHCLYFYWGRLRCLIRQRCESKTFCPGQSGTPTILQAHLPSQWDNFCLAHPRLLLNQQHQLIKKSSVLSLGICRIQGRYCQWPWPPPFPSLKNICEHSSGIPPSVFYFRRQQVLDQCNLSGRNYLHSTWERNFWKRWQPIR